MGGDKVISDSCQLKLSKVCKVQSAPILGNGLKKIVEQAEAELCQAQSTLG